MVEILIAFKKTKGKGTTLEKMLAMLLLECFRGLVQSPYGKINVIMTLGGVLADFSFSCVMHFCG